MPLNTKTGGQARHIKDRGAMSLMNEQARHIYEKVESESIINVETTKREIEADRLDNNLEGDEINPYHKLIKNKVEKENTITSQMEQWSIMVMYLIMYNTIHTLEIFMI